MNTKTLNISECGTDEAEKNPQKILYTYRRFSLSLSRPLSVHAFDDDFDMELEIMRANKLKPQYYSSFNVNKSARVSIALSCLDSILP